MRPVYIIAELGINHGGSLAMAVDLMRVAKAAGADAVKLQRRDLALAIPPHMRDIPRDTPEGVKPYSEYKRGLEMGRREYRLLQARSAELGLDFSASAFDPPSVGFLAKLGVPWIKIPSATLTDHDTLRAAKATGLPIILSTGGSSWAEIDAAVDVLSGTRLTLMATCAVYPHTPEQARLLVMDEMRLRYGLPVGWSGHDEPESPEVTLAAVARGAVMVERHITLSRLQMGSDQAASLEPAELASLVRQIRRVERALTTGAERPVDEAERKKIMTMRRSAWTKKGEAA